MSASANGQRRPNRLLAGLLLILGVLCFVVGAALAWGSNPLLGFSIGGVGTVLLVVGSIMARHAMVARFLEGEHE
jgi:membrane-bound ClpP family serine protease